MSEFDQKDTAGDTDTDDSELKSQQKKLKEEHDAANKLNNDSLSEEMNTEETGVVDEEEESNESKNLSRSIEDSISEDSEDQAVIMKNDSTDLQNEKEREEAQLKTNTIQTAEDEADEADQNQIIEKEEEADEKYEAEDTENESKDAAFFEKIDTEKTEREKELREKTEVEDNVILEEQDSLERASERKQIEKQKAEHDRAQEQKEQERRAKHSKQLRHENKISTAATTSSVLYAAYKCRDFLQNNWRFLVALAIVIAGIILAYKLYKTRNESSNIPAKEIEPEIEEEAGPVPPLEAAPSCTPASPTCSQGGPVCQHQNTLPQPLAGEQASAATTHTASNAATQSNATNVTNVTNVTTETTSTVPKNSDTSPNSADSEKVVSRAADGRTDLLDMQQQQQKSAPLRLNDGASEASGVSEENDNVDIKQTNRADTNDAYDSEVFNISSNIYTYDDAIAVCSALGTRLATEEEVHRAYTNGANWCNYGWTHGQLALYPTQQETYEKLQQSDEHKNDCGKAGVNGGYFANKDLRFGVNCYGKKPEPSKTAGATNAGYFPDYISEKERRLQEKVNTFRSNLSEIEILPFNRNKWDKDRTLSEKISDVFD
jgi:hypothetical protein